MRSSKVSKRNLIRRRINDIPWSRESDGELASGARANRSAWRDRVSRPQAKKNRSQRVDADSSQYRHFVPHFQYDRPGQERQGTLATGLLDQVVGEAAPT